MLKEYTVAEGVLAFSTMRKGGVSLGNYSEFNINEYCGDSSEHIWENRRLLAERLGVSADHIVMPHQVHGIEVRRVDGEFFSKPEPVRKMILEGVDALITDLRIILRTGSGFEKNSPSTLRTSMPCT